VLLTKGITGHDCQLSQEIAGGMTGIFVTVSMIAGWLVMIDKGEGFIGIRVAVVGALQAATRSARTLNEKSIGVAQNTDRSCPIFESNLRYLENYL
jgi:hypothetical protein